MPRKAEKDNFGGVNEFKLPEIKRCPVCRREVEESEIEYIKDMFKEHPEVDDHGYELEKM